MITLRRTDSSDIDFVALVKELDAELAALDGDDHAFYAQLNKLPNVDTVVAYLDDKPVACGAIRAYSDEAMEVKRMYTRGESRGKGIAALVLSELEKWTREKGFHSCILETGKRQPDAIALYKKSGYEIIPNYGSYVNDANSVCFQKQL